MPGFPCTTRAEVWLSGEADLLVWEAFVSGTGKPVPADTTQHAAVAKARLQPALFPAIDWPCDGQLGLLQQQLVADHRAGLRDKAPAAIADFSDSQ